MKKLILFFLIPIISYSQDFNLPKMDPSSGSDIVGTWGGQQTWKHGFKYLVLFDLNWNSSGINTYGINDRIRNIFTSKGFQAFTFTDENSYPNLESKYKPCLNLRAIVTFSSQVLSFKLVNCKGENIYEGDYKTKYDNIYSGRTFEGELNRSLKKMLKPFEELNFEFDPKIQITPKFEQLEMFEENEVTLREYFDSNNLDEIEGIFKSVPKNNDPGFDTKVGIKKIDDKFVGITLERGEYSNFSEGELKFNLESAAGTGIYTCTYYSNNKTKRNGIATLKEGVLLEIDYGGDESEKTTFIKLYPDINSSSTSSIKKPKSNEWSGNGSGIIISKSGYIITNNHVIQDANEIEVEFILDGEVQKFNAEEVMTDKINDLAILKIFDMNFDGLENIPYNFKTRSSDVGTKIYAYGYPMALTLMGKEIKITDGIISSKTGFDGDITSYQISASIQPGNSGGPLFDDKANLIGINSSGLARLGSETTGYSIKTSYVLNLIDVLPKAIELPSSTKLESLPLTEQIKEISKFVVLVKVK